MTEDDFQKTIEQIKKDRKKILTEQKLALKDIIGNFPISKNEKNEILKTIYSEIDSLNKSELKQFKEEYFQKAEEAERNYDGSRLEVELSFLRDEMINSLRSSQNNFHQEVTSIMNYEAPQYCNLYMNLMDTHYQNAFPSLIPEEFKAELAGRQWLTELVFSY
ncbi:MAG: hypothetical protein N4A31_03000 [Rickettsiales bacterium]|jgi:hypothetical protein|nr:hypothetical protein [Rickettsiales bacterium]